MIGELISAGTNLIGGFLNRGEARANRESQERMAQQNIALQKQFAQEGIRWKVEDAKQAGIHPLYALGANTSSFSPVSIGNTADTSLGDSMSRAGQDIGRAINATRTAPEREAAMQQTALQLEGLKLDNDIKRAAIASSVQKLRANANPPMPVAGPVPEADKYEERPKLMAGGQSITTDPYSTNAEDFEKRYGDLAQELAGVQNMWRDYQYTTKGWTWPQELRAWGIDPRFVPGGFADRARAAIMEGIRRGNAYRPADTFKRRFGRW